MSTPGLVGETSWQYRWIPYGLEAATGVDTTQDTTMMEAIIVVIALIFIIIIVDVSTGFVVFGFIDHDMDTMMKAILIVIALILTFANAADAEDGDGVDAEAEGEKGLGHP